MGNFLFHLFEALGKNTHDGNHPEIIAFRFFIVGFTLSKVLTENKEENFNLFITVSEKLKKQLVHDSATYHLLNNRMSEYSKVLKETADMNHVSKVVGMKFQQYATNHQSRLKMTTDKLFDLYSKKVLSIYDNFNDKSDEPSLATKITILLASAFVVAIVYGFGIPNSIQSDNTDNRVTTTTPPSVSPSNSTDNINNMQNPTPQPNSSLKEEELQKAELQTIHQFAQAYHNDMNAGMKLIEQNPNCSQSILQMGTMLGENWANIIPMDKIVLTQAAMNSWECLGNNTTLTADEVVTYIDNLLIHYPNDKIIDLWNLFQAVFQFDMEANKE